MKWRVGALIGGGLWLTVSVFLFASSVWTAFILLGVVASTFCLMATSLLSIVGKPPSIEQIADEVCVRFGFDNNPEYKEMIRAFTDEGFLLEVNRQFLHPLGWSLFTLNEGDHPAGLILRCADEDEVFFDFEGHEAEVARKAQNVAAQWVVAGRFRKAILGYVIQPVPSPGHVGEVPHGA